MKNPESDRLTLPQIAEVLQKSSSWLRDIRSRDGRFPKPDAAGRYSLATVAKLLVLRQLGSMSDAAYNSDRRDWAHETLAGITAGRIPGVARKDSKPLEEFCHEVLNGQHDYDEHGKPARLVAIEGLYNELERLSGGAVVAGEQNKSRTIRRKKGVK